MIVIPKLPSGIITLSNAEKGTTTSPIVNIIDFEKVKVWLIEVKKIIRKEITSSSFACCAPETHRKAYWMSLDFLTKKIEEGESFKLWDANREIAGGYRYFDDEGFQDACIALFT